MNHSGNSQTWVRCSCAVLSGLNRAGDAQALHLSKRNQCGEEKEVAKRGNHAGGSHLLSEMEIVSFAELLSIIFWEQDHHHFTKRSQAVFITLYYFSWQGPLGCSLKRCVMTLLCLWYKSPETSTDFHVLSSPAQKKKGGGNKINSQRTKCSQAIVVITRINCS